MFIIPSNQYQISTLYQMKKGNAWRSITRIMKELCTREVWSRYSRYGQREFISLQKTTIYECMISK